MSVDKSHYVFKRFGFGAWLFMLCLWVIGARNAQAAPEAHILRIDPRTAQDNGSPILTTVVEVVENKRVSDATMHCGTLKGSSELSCLSEALEKPYALYTPFPFPAQNAVLTVHIDSGDTLATYVSQSRWGESQQQPGVGTAWLIIVNADSRMGGAFRDARNCAAVHREYGPERHRKRHVHQRPHGHGRFAMVARGSKGQSDELRPSRGDDVSSRRSQPQPIYYHSHRCHRRLQIARQR